ncbi:sensor histidine kinase [Deinococcus petrolearius]|uniref:histidine kinase n=1 Tax=Deinococcus petrolearius TaxID=1751295 RepID=A0ABW1DS77_9DEIO
MRWHLLRFRVSRVAALREALLAALPLMLTAALLVLVSLPSFRPERFVVRPWTYAYQGLVQDVQAYQVARLQPGLSPAERGDVRDRALSSSGNRAQFRRLNAVQSYGEARLAHVDALLRRDTDASVAAAATEAIGLNVQANLHASTLSRQNIGVVTVLRQALIWTAVLTGLLSVLLIVRALWLWQQERDRLAAREARQREALRLASHELRRPLQQLLLATDLLRQAGTVAERQHLLALVEDSVTQLASRADLTRLNELYLDVHLRLAPRDLGLLLRAFAGVRVAVQVPPTPLVWAVDANRLRQAVENLVENALKYTAGPVELSLLEVGGRPQILVRDHGPGLSAELRERAFLAYERGPQGLIAGQGLGLSLVRRYARAHGGDVTLEDAAGGGTLARLSLGLGPVSAPF